MTKLAIFDIDGTLVNSTEVDAECFVRSITEEFGIHDIDDHWEHYKNVTDAGVFEEILEKAFARKPSESEVQRHIKAFLRLLEASHAEDPGLFREVPGARNIVARLRNHPEWKIAIATGAWCESALFKLRAAGISAEGIPLVTGSEEKVRERLVLRCIGEAERHYVTYDSRRSKVKGRKSGVDAGKSVRMNSHPQGFDTARGTFEKIVSIGDGIWDYEAAKRVGIGFVMIDVKGRFGGSEDFKTLRDYRDQELFMKRLEEAANPPFPPLQRGI
ncbi:MAG: HAD family phosphatase [Candidatus Lindowbacteria bacterium]|nr:HAD family phosphatase [Candidatus Lindowbacteria bacterium]